MASSPSPSLAASTLVLSPQAGIRPRTAAVQIIQDSQDFNENLPESLASGSPLPEDVDAIPPVENIEPIILDSQDIFQDVPQSVTDARPLPDAADDTQAVQDVGTELAVDVVPGPMIPESDFQSDGPSPSASQVLQDSERTEGSVNKELSKRKKLEECGDTKAESKNLQKRHRSEDA